VKGANVVLFWGTKCNDDLVDLPLNTGNVVKDAAGRASKDAASCRYANATMGRRFNDILNFSQCTKTPKHNSRSAPRHTLSDVFQRMLIW
jgi:hypothetical protein